MADKSNQPDSIELKDFTKELESDLDDEKNLDETDEDKVNKPLLEQQNDSPEAPSRVPNQSIDPTATVDQIERESLLVRETNIDNLDEIQAMEQMEIEEAKPTTRSKIPNIDVKSIIIVALVAAGLVILFFILIVLIPSCIDSLDYTEYALRRSKLTGAVNDEYVYEPGLHFVSPFSDWIKFNKTVHTIRLNGLTLFTTDKLQVNVTFMIYYFLNKDTLGKLYRNHGTSYKELISSVVKSELQILGQKFSIDEYRLKRIEIKSYLRNKMSTRLNDYGLKLHDLLMLQLRFSNRINTLNLKRMIIGIQNEEALHNKTTEMIRQETNYQTEVLKNKARLERETAALTGNNTIVKIESIEAQAKIEMATLDGLNTNLKELNFYDRSANSSKKVLSFCWVNTLLYMKDNLNIYNNELKLDKAIANGVSLGVITI